MKVHELVRQLLECNQEATTFLVEKYTVDDGDGYTDEMEDNEAIKKVTLMGPFMVIIT